jgi:hypothetical protein
MFNLTECQSRLVLLALFKLKRGQKVLNMSDYVTMFIKNKYTLLLICFYYLKTFYNYCM